jgi:hypothetical protein
MGKEIDVENIYGDYRDFDGIRTNTKLTTTRDGKPFLECEITYYKAVESIPKTRFGKPQAGDAK